MENDRQYSILLEDLNEPLTNYLDPNAPDMDQRYKSEERTIIAGPTYYYGNPRGSQPVRIPLENREIANPQGLIRLLEGGVAIFQDTALNSATRRAEVISSDRELGRTRKLRTSQKTAIRPGEAIIYDNYRMTLKTKEIQEQ